MYGITTEYGSPTVEKAPTLMEALVQIQKRLATLEARVDRIEIHQQPQQMLVWEESECSNSGISDEHYYGDGMRGENNAE